MVHIRRILAEVSTVSMLRRALFVAALCWFVPGTVYALPPGRAYEMVTPPYKGGYGAGTVLAAAPNGEAVIFVSLGAFAGADASNANDDYIARRGDLVWTTSPVMPPGALAPFSFPVDFSADIGATLAEAGVAPDVGAGTYEGTEAYFLKHNNESPDAPQNWEVSGGILMKLLNGQHLVPIEAGASADLCHIFVLPEAPLLEEAAGTDAQIYDLATGCRGETPRLHLLGLDNSGHPINPNCMSLGSSSGKQSTLGAVSADGRKIFFTAKTGNANCTEPTEQIFERLDGERTLEISAPQAACEGQLEVPCPGAALRAASEFQGASEEGATVYFTTTERLVASDTDGGSDLYMTTVGCARGATECSAQESGVTAMTQVSHGDEPADVQGTVRISPDGTRAYFVARGVLDPKPNAQGVSAVKGADNLYVYDKTTGTVTYIAALCSGPSSSGAVFSESRCPTDLDPASNSTNDTQLWLGEGEAQVSDNSGRCLVFATYAKLSRNDTDNAKDVYRYDATSGALDRVSLGENGYDANGNRNDERSPSPELSKTGDATISDGHISGNLARDYSEHDLGTRGISEDGSRIVFASSEPLSPGAINGFVNAYEWHDGAVSLVSTGIDREPVSDVVISPSGRDLFFSTVQPLLPQDTDEAFDVYDARVDGGFPAPPAERQPCAGDGCQGPLTNPAPELVPGSVSQAPGENFEAPRTKAVARKAAKRKKIRSVKRRKFKARGSARTQGSRSRKGGGRHGS